MSTRRRGAPIPHNSTPDTPENFRERAGRRKNQTRARSSSSARFFQGRYQSVSRRPAGEPCRFLTGPTFQAGIRAHGLVYLYLRDEMNETLKGTADTERESRLDAERVTLEFAQKSTRKLDAGKKPMTESPLFGGEAQGSLF